MPPPRHIEVALAILAAIVAFGSGCATRTVRQTIYEDSQIRVVLREQKRGGETIERGYDHPLAVAPVRLAHILSRIDIRIDDEKQKQRVPALPTQALYVVADHLSKAFGQANSNQEIAVYYIRRAKRFQVFDRRYLTSFVIYADADALYIHLSRTDWEIQKKGKKERLPVPRIGDHVMNFRIVPSKGMALVDSQAVAVDWENPVFKKPTRTRISPDGKVVRRTILMESAEETGEVEDVSLPDQLPENLSSATLRALADLEDERRLGDINEAEYNARRRRIIRADPASP